MSMIMRTVPLLFFNDLREGRYSKLRGRAIVAAATIAAMTAHGDKLTQRKIKELSGMSRRTVGAAVSDLRAAGFLPMTAQRAEKYRASAQ